MAAITVSSCAMLRETRSAMMGRAMVHWVGFSFVVRWLCCVVL